MNGRGNNHGRTHARLHALAHDFRNRPRRRHDHGEGHRFQHPRGGWKRGATEHVRVCWIGRKHASGKPAHVFQHRAADATGVFRRPDQADGARREKRIERPSPRRMEPAACEFGVWGGGERGHGGHGMSWLIPSCQMEPAASPHAVGESSAFIAGAPTPGAANGGSKRIPAEGQILHSARQNMQRGNAPTGLDLARKSQRSPGTPKMNSIFYANPILSLACVPGGTSTFYSPAAAARLTGVHGEMLRYYCRLGLIAAHRGVLATRTDLRRRCASRCAPHETLPTAPRDQPSGTPVDLRRQAGRRALETRAPLPALRMNATTNRQSKNGSPP